jgi:predicted nucleotide-binding protein (sugar kinase/HSP70/actin superfamily)
VQREVNLIEEEGKEQIKEDLDDFVIVSREQKLIRPKIEGKDKTQIHVNLNQLTVSLIMNSHEYMNIVLRNLLF